MNIDYLIWAVSNKECLSPGEKQAIAVLLQRLKGETQHGA